MKTNKGITLIALVITIIILIILAGVTLSLVLGKNGLLEKARKGAEDYQYAGLRERIESEILALDMEKVVKGETLTIEDALIGLQASGTFEETDATSNSGVCEGYVVELGYNADGKVVINGITKDTGTRIVTTLNPIGYTNGKVEVTIEVRSDGKTITNVEVQEGMNKKANTSEQDYIYEVEANGTYNVKATLNDGTVIEKDIVIATIDTLPPQEFTPTTQIILGGFIINANTEDAESDENSVKSGIDHYEYYVDNAKQANNKITVNEEKTYKVYVIAYDKTGNDRQSNTIDVEYIQKAPVIILSNGDWTNQSITASVDWGIADETCKKEISIDGGITYTTYTNPVTIDKNTTIKAKLSFGATELIGELEVNKIDKLEPKEFTPKISDLVSDTELTINANTADQDANENYGKSNIKGYQYFVYQGDNLIDNSDIITAKSWTASNLEVGQTYKIYVDAYDNAGNKKTGYYNENYTKLKVYQWKQYAANVKTTYNYQTNGEAQKYEFNNNNEKYNRLTKVYIYEISSFSKATGEWELSSSDTANMYAWTSIKNSNDGFNFNGSTTSIYKITEVTERNTSNAKFDVDVTAINLVSYKQESYSKKGDMIKYVTSNDENAYQENGYQDGYWYEKVQ